MGIIKWLFKNQKKRNANLKAGLANVKKSAQDLKKAAKDPDSYLAEHGDKSSSELFKEGFKRGLGQEETPQTSEEDEEKINS